MKVDMSRLAVTKRMKMLDQLWELAVALKSSKIVLDTGKKLPTNKKSKVEINDGKD
jgi:hypothetical protein